MAVDGGLEVEAIVVRGGIEQLLRREGAELRERCGLAVGAEMIAEVRVGGFDLVRGRKDGVDADTAFKDRALKEAGGEWRGDEIADVEGA